MSDDEMFYAEAASRSDEGGGAAPWTVLIVDDDQGVHDITVFSLKTVTFRGRSLRFLHAYSAQEGLDVVRANDDIALVFLDVVMETDDAGLRFARVLRQELERLSLRVILRTGQPGLAPERRVIVDYDINDYKEKTELTAEKLFVSTVTALRAYDDIRTIERYKDAAYATLAQETDISRQILEFVPVPLLQTDALGFIISCSRQAADLLGVDPIFAPGVRIEGILPGLRLDVAASQELALPSGRTHRVHARPVVLSDGSTGGHLVRLEAAY